MSHAKLIWLLLSIWCAAWVGFEITSIVQGKGSLPIHVFGLVIQMSIGIYALINFFRRY